MGVAVEYNYLGIIQIPVSVTGQSANLAPASGKPPDSVLALAPPRSLLSEMVPYR